MRVAAAFIIAIALVLAYTGTAHAQSEYPQAGTVSADKVNVRANPDVKNGAILGRVSLDLGVTVRSITTDGKWYKIDYPAHIPQYVYAKYIRVNADGSGSIIGSQVRVRAEANTKSTIVTELGRNYPVTILGKKGSNWYKIQALANSRCFISSDFVILTGVSEIIENPNKVGKTPLDTNDSVDASEAETVEVEYDPIQAEIDARNLARANAIAALDNSTADARAVLAANELTPVEPAVEKDENFEVAKSTVVVADPVAYGVVEIESADKYSPFTHRVRRSGITLYFIRSDTVDLEKYENKRCAIFGDVGDELSRITRRRTIEVTSIEEIIETTEANKE